MRILATCICVPILSLLSLALQDPGTRDVAQRGVGVNPRSLVRIVDNVIIVENGATLMEVVNTVSPIAKRTVLAGRDSMPKLQSTQLNLSEPLRVSLDRAAELLDSVMLPNDMAFIPPSQADLAWRVVDLKGNDRLSIRGSSKQIQLDEVDTYANRAICVSVTIPLKNISAREVSGSLRPFFPDNNLDTVTNVGNSNQLLLFGMAPTVAQMAKLIKAMDIPDSEEVTVRRKVESDQSAAIASLTKRIDSLEKELQGLKDGPSAKPREGK